MKALIIIDIQKGLTKKKVLHNEKLFFDSINKAIKDFRDAGSKIVFMQHNNNQLINGTSDWEIDERINKEQHDTIIQKNHGNAFQKTNLKEILLAFQIDNITIGGLSSHGCVKATCLGGINEGFEVSLLKNGHTSWNKDAAKKISMTEIEIKEMMKN